MAPENQSLHDRIAANVTAIRGRIAAAAERAGRSPDEVTLVAVTKTVDLAAAEILVALGITDMGENRMPDALAKVDPLRKAVRWHMLGNVQRRKARDILGRFDSIDAIDRVSVAETLQRHCEERNISVEVLLEVNVSGETTKHGFTPAELPDRLRDLASLDRVHIKGLMTMAPFDADESTLRRHFATLRKLARASGLSELSMGMSNDFEIAIEEGATQIRIGSALFE